MKPQRALIVRFVPSLVDCHLVTCLLVSISDRIAQIFIIRFSNCVFSDVFELVTPLTVAPHVSHNRVSFQWDLLQLHFKTRFAGFLSFSSCKANKLPICIFPYCCKNMAVHNAASWPVSHMTLTEHYPSASRELYITTVFSWFFQGDSSLTSDPNSHWRRRFPAAYKTASL